MVLIFFFNDTATSEIYTLSLHDALPISPAVVPWRRNAHRGPSASSGGCWCRSARRCCGAACGDRKSTRLNFSHANISYAVFCLKKKNVMSYLTSYNDC